MGKIIELNFEDIIPNQKSLIPNKIENFLRSYLENSDKKVIVPVVPWSKAPFKKSLIDGHHRVAGLYLLHKMDEKYKIYGWLAEDKHDLVKILPEEFYQEVTSLKKSNFEIKERFNYAKNCPYMNLEELINQYLYMNSVQTMLKRFNLVLK
jgi:hypothetical protein